eukprot:5329168-Heterocapsa_arctica.AAC.1
MASTTSRQAGELSLPAARGLHAAGGADGSVAGDPQRAPAGGRRRSPRGGAARRTPQAGRWTVASGALASGG